MYAYQQRLHLCADAVTCFAFPGGRTSGLLGDTAATALPALAQRILCTDGRVHQPTQRIEV